MNRYAMTKMGSRLVRYGVELEASADDDEDRDLAARAVGFGLDLMRRAARHPAADVESAKDMLAAGWVPNLDDVPSSLHAYRDSWRQADPSPAHHFDFPGPANPADRPPFYLPVQPVTNGVDGVGRWECCGMASGFDHHDNCPLNPTPKDIPT